MASSADLIVNIIGNSTSARDALDKFQAKMVESGEAMKTLGRWGQIGAAAISVGAVAAIKMASDYQAQMTLLETAGGEAHKNIGMVSDGILNLATTTGTSTGALADGMYTVEKAGIRGAAGLQVLKAAAKGAKAENVDLGTATNAVTSLLMSYHLKASDAVSIENQLVAASGMGISSVATCGLPTSRSFSSVSRSQSMQMAMLLRLMYGLWAHDSRRTSRDPWAPAIWLSSLVGIRY